MHHYLPVHVSQSTARQSAPTPVFISSLYNKSCKSKNKEEVEMDVAVEFVYNISTNWQTKTNALR